MKKIFAILLLALCAFGAELKVAAAANVAVVANELKKAFAKTHPNDSVEITLASSGKLVAQIKNGAPFELFMAANVDFAKSLSNDGFGVGEVAVYAKGKVALFSARGVDLSKGLQSLKNAKIKTIVIANPKTAPYGTASMQAMQNAKIYDEIKSKIIYAGSIGEALSQTISAADIGFVAGSALYDEKMSKFKEGKDYIFIDSTLYEPIAQAMIITKTGENSKLAKEFYDFILSQDAKAIFAKYGYEF